ncbi:C39 family peptidase [bacterium]|nr:C39 family peptidase [bacterium]
MRAKLVVGLAVALAGCVSSPAVSEFHADVRLRADANVAAVTSELPFFPSPEERDCGPSALATALACSGVPASPDDLREELFSRERGGTPASALVRAARRRHVFALVREKWYLDDLEAWIRAGVAPIICISTEPFSPGFHFVLLKGYDEQGRTVLFQDQGRKDATMSMDELFPRWCAASGWAVVVCSPSIVLPRGECGLTARELGALGWLAEQQGDLFAARRHYRSALARDPGFESVAHNLANVERALAGRSPER